MNAPSAPIRGRAALLLLAAMSALYVAEVARVWVVSEWTASSDPKLWLRASRLEPGNATVWDRLGMAALQSWNGGDVSRAVTYLQRAASANPRSDQIWLDLAEAYEMQGDASRVRMALGNAERAHPISSEVAWRFGNFLLRSGDIGSAFAKFRRALEVDASLRWNVLAVCDRSSGETARILDEALPRTSAMYLGAVNYFVAANRPDAALMAWERLLALGQHIDLPQSLRLIDALIAQGRTDDAKRVWKQALDVAQWPHEDDGGSLVFNGGFEHDWVNGGFDWQITQVSGVEIEADAAVFHGGRRSLRVTFDGSANLDFQNVIQYIAVEPGRTYEFSAYLRTAGLSTDSGLRMELIGAGADGRAETLTPDLEDTRTWTKISERVTAGPTTRLLRIVLRRLPSEKLDNRLRGTAWLDDVSLVPLPDREAAGLP